MFFENWYGIFRVLIVGVLAYVALIFWLRISGKRSLSKWNAFDFVVTIALGSTMASIILSKDVPYFEGVAALVLLILLQLAITWLSVRSERIENLVKAKPTLLLDKGNFLYQAMKDQRVTESEIRAAVRSAGLASLESAEAVVIETDGSLSVIKRSGDNSLPHGQQQQRSALEDVEGNNID